MSGVELVTLKGGRTLHCVCFGGRAGCRWPDRPKIPPSSCLSCLDPLQLGKQSALVPVISRHAGGNQKWYSPDYPVDILGTS